MQKLSFIFLAAVIFLAPGSVWAMEAVESFEVSAELQSNRLLRVTENITYDFEDEERHGIYREIPTDYSRNGAAYNLRLRVVAVTMDAANVPYTVEKRSDGLSIKIGDPDTLISGRRTYSITYETNRAINFFPDHSELYWNVTGDRWLVPIGQSSFTLTLPGKGEIVGLRAACFTGAVGSVEQDCESRVDGSSVSFQTNKFLSSLEGLTVVIGMPQGLISEPNIGERFLMLLKDNWVLIIPFLALVAMSILWYLKGRDPKLGAVIPLYESPEGLNPTMLAAVRGDGAVPGRALTAAILDLARRGYLKIRYEVENGWSKKKLKFTLIKIKAADSLLSPDEGLIFNGLFNESREIKTDELKKGRFYLDALKAQEVIWRQLRDRKIFEKKPKLVRATYIGLAIVLVWVLDFLVGYLPLGAWVVVGAGIIVAVFGWFMPQRTLRGVKLLAQVKGFEWFLSVAEKERLKFHNAPEKTPEQFQEMLPYAVALGIEKEWAEQFKGMTIPQPDWAEGSGWNGLTPVIWVSSLEFMRGQVSSGYYAPSSAGAGKSGFSGGGRSGGGFGGGGGGSW